VSIFRRLVRRTLEINQKEAAMQYLLLIYGDERRWHSVSDEERGPIMQKWFAYTEELREAGVLVAGDALQPTTTATTVQFRDSETLTTDGPFAETKEQLGGYYLVDVESADEAIEWASKMPVREGKVEVRPTVQLPAEVKPA
jgi:hypothetical protein